MKTYWRLILLLLALTFAWQVAALGLHRWRLLEGRRAGGEGDAAQLRPVSIRPDYANVVIPPNIAPLDFRVLEPGVEYYVRIVGREGEQIEILSRTGDICIPGRNWRRLLHNTRGGQIRIEVKAKQRSGRWQRYRPISNWVAREPVDPYLLYRSIPPLYNFWSEIEIRQRHLESFQDRAVLPNLMVGRACLNCHALCQNRPDRMTLGVRSSSVGSSTIMVEHSVATKIGTKFGYTAWHPSGQLVAYSVNEVRQFFHSAGSEVRDVVDLDSGLAYYDLRTQTAKTAPAINDPDRLETYPTWSPDGKYLYFCSAAFPWTNRSQMPPSNYRECRYDLRRVAYDLATDKWGKPETVLSSAKWGKSILLPRISPDGRFLLCCMCEYGCFPIYQPSSDLYLLDLKTGSCRRLEINSPYSESWHSWSSNGRWIAFSSKRGDGLFTRTYLSYVDSLGKVYRPVLVPQKDPAFYETYLKTFTVPELAAKPVSVKARQLASAILDVDQIKVSNPVKLELQPKTGAAASDAPWQSGRR